jgi:cytochrome c biogenesis protein CcdA
MLTAILLGLLVAVNPCQLAICLSALTYLTKAEEKGNRRHGWMFATGRATTYTLLGIVVYVLLQQGLTWFNIDHIPDSPFVHVVEDTLPYLMFAIGAFFLLRTFIHHRHNGSCHNSGTIIRRKAARGSFFLGMLLALLFCPESAILYFGVLLPMSLTSSWGLLLIVLFAVSATIPVVLLNYLMVVSRASTRRWEHRMEYMQQWLNAATGLLFIGLGIWLLI